MRHLIEAVLRDPCAALRDRSEAANEIVAAGVAALPAIREVLDGKYESRSHPRDVLEAFSYLAGRIRANSGEYSGSEPGSA